MNTTAALALLSAALAQTSTPAPGTTPPAPQPSPTPATTPAVEPISAEARAVLDRAANTYKNAKTYSETVLNVMRQKARGVPPDQQPPETQASRTSLRWAGPERFAVQSRDFDLYKNGKQATIYIKSLGQYTQREPLPADNAVFANMVDLHPTYQALRGLPAGAVFGRFQTVNKMNEEEFEGRPGTRLIGTAIPPLMGFEVPSPVTMWFEKQSGLLGHAEYDLRPVMQEQLDKNRALQQVPAGTPKVIIDRFTISTTFLNTAIDADLPESLTTFAPGPRDAKVDDFDMSSGAQSLQQTTIPGRAAPELSGTTLDGKPWSLAALKGKVVLLQFWSANAQSSLPTLEPTQRLFDAFVGKEVAIVSVNQDDQSTHDLTRRLLADRKALYTTVADAEKSIGHALRVAELPCTIIIDKDGIVQAIDTGFDIADFEVNKGRIERLLSGLPLVVTPAPAPSAASDAPAAGTPSSKP